MRLWLLRFLAFWLIMGLVVGISGTGSSNVLAAGQNGRLPAERSVSQASLPTLIASSPSCYTWDFLNNIGEDATGLVVHLKGISSITDVYTGVSNPFGTPDPSSGYDPISGVYTLIFKGGTAYNGDQVQIGICSHQAVLRLDTVQPAFYWVIAGVPVTPAPLFAGLDFSWVDSNHLQVHLYNDQSTVLTVYSFSALSPEAPLSLDDLNVEIASTLSIVSDQVADPFDLSAGGIQTFDIYFDEGGVRVPYGAPVILEATLTAQDDPGNPIHLLAQTSQPFQQAYLPLVTK